MFKKLMTSSISCTNINFCHSHHSSNLFTRKTIYLKHYYSNFNKTNITQHIQKLHARIDTMSDDMVVKSNFIK